VGGEGDNSVGTDATAVTSTLYFIFHQSCKLCDAPFAIPSVEKSRKQRISEFFAYTTYLNHVY